jgi:beta-ketodecanoyl-[acyl-carrier-protein] synthase
MKVAITGSGLFAPSESISNDELVAAFNGYVAAFNQQHEAAILAGEVTALSPSSSEFIEKASGIKSRHVVNKSGVLDVTRMRPEIRTRGNEEVSLLAEMGVAAAHEALSQARLLPEQIDGVIVACSNLQRAYPAIAVEVQHELGIQGFGYDMNVACASAAFGVQAAVDAVRQGSARAMLVVSPEICTGHLNFCDRDSHFIFGDAATAVVVQRLDEAHGEAAFEVLGTRLKTQFSNNIRNNAGFLNRAEVPPRSDKDVLFVQEGRKVFKEVVPMVAELLQQHLADLGLQPEQVRRFFLHQANLNMNLLIAKKVLGRDPLPEEAPIILDTFANTSSAGSVIAFHQHRKDLQVNDVAVLCAFGAGYSAGSVVMRKLR